jgi:diacylglycerol kinase family enzyme
LAVRTWLAAEADRRSVELVELGSCEHFAEADRATRECGADALALSGGDEAQSSTAVVAAGRELPYACIPTGRHNLFARDLGVDVQDAIRAMDVFVDFCECDVDLAEVNGLAFVNYVSVGLHCEPTSERAQHLPDPRGPASPVSYVVARRACSPRLHWFGAGRHETGRAVFVSNNRYRFQAMQIGGRARLDAGVLGIGMLDSNQAGGSNGGCEGRWNELCAPSFELDCDVPVLAEIDGRVISVDPPVRFRSLPRALRVRIPLPG